MKEKKLLTNTCPFNECDGSGMIGFTKDGYDYFKKCKCYNIQVRKQTSGIPIEFREVSISSFDVSLYKDKALAKKAKDYSVMIIKKFKKFEEYGKGFYFFSDKKGSGKTRLACSILNAVIKQDLGSVKFLTVTGLLGKLKETYSNVDISELDVMKRYNETDVLVLDDIGLEKVTEWVNEKLFDIIDYRISNKKITIFTSNCKINDLKLGSRIISRIEKMVIPVKFPEESIRSELGRLENEEFMRELVE